MAQPPRKNGPYAYDLTLNLIFNFWVLVSLIGYCILGALLGIVLTLTTATIG